jgi:hypothetical protein
MLDIFGIRQLGLVGAARTFDFCGSGLTTANMSGDSFSWHRN